MHTVDFEAARIISLALLQLHFNRRQESKLASVTYCRTCTVERSVDSQCPTLAATKLSCLALRPTT